MNGTQLLKQQYQRRITKFFANKFKTLISDKQKELNEEEELTKRLKHYPFFKDVKHYYLNHKNSETLITQLIMSVELRSFESNTYLFQSQGNVECIYIIIDGKVKETISSEDNSSFFRTEGYTFYSQYLKQYDSEALCATQCLIGGIPLYLYLALREMYDALERVTEIEFMNKMYVFRTTSTGVIENYYNNCTKHFYNNNDILYEQGQEIKGLYFIRQGEIELSMNYKEQTSPQVKDDNNGEGNVNDSNDNKYDNFKLGKRYQNNNDYRIIRVGVGDFLGDIEYKLKRTSQAYFTAKCVFNNTLVYMIPFDMIRETFVLSVFKRFFESIENKEKLLKERMGFLTRIKTTNQKKKYHQFSESTFDIKFKEQDREFFNKMSYHPIKKIKYVSVKKKKEIINVFPLLSHEKAKKTKGLKTNYNMMYNSRNASFNRTMSAADCMFNKMNQSRHISSMQNSMIMDSTKDSYHKNSKKDNHLQINSNKKPHDINLCFGNNNNNKGKGKGMMKRSLSILFGKK